MMIAQGSSRNAAVLISSTPRLLPQRLRRRRLYGLAAHPRRSRQRQYYPCIMRSLRLMNTRFNAACALDARRTLTRGKEKPRRSPVVRYPRQGRPTGSGLALLGALLRKCRLVAAACGDDRSRDPNPKHLQAVSPSMSSRLDYLPRHSLSVRSGNRQVASRGHYRE